MKTARLKLMKIFNAVKSDVFHRYEHKVDFLTPRMNAKLGMRVCEAVEHAGEGNKCLEILWKAKKVDKVQNNVACL